MNRLPAVSLAMAALLSAPAFAQTYPAKPVHIVVGFSSGAATDSVARMLAQKFTDSWGMQVVVENVPGAGGNAAGSRVAKAAPDGYTLGLFIEQQMVVNPSLYTMPFDPIKDFSPVSKVAATSLMLSVNNAVPARSVRELVALAKASPGKLTYASGGSGSAPHVATELFRAASGIDIRHIPYKGVTQAIPDVLQGRVDMMFSPIQNVLAQVRDGKLRPLAVTSLKRSTVVPDIPTIAESGYPGFEAGIWYGLFAPAQTPAPIVSRLNEEVLKAVALADVKEKLAGFAIETIGGSPAELAASVRTAIPVWAKLVKDAGIKAE
jgi:tripartite-type tricarboxylate transporter receptor subunit TctC